MRQAGDRTPILMLTARDAIDDRVPGPRCRRRRLPGKAVRAARAAGEAARALAPRRRRRRAHGEVLQYADLVLDPVAHEVHRGDRLIDLSKTEFLLLELFMRHPRQVLTRSDDLRERVGLRLRADVKRARCVHGIPPAQDRGGRRAAAPAHRAGRRLRVARLAMSLRKRLSLVAAAAVGIAILLAVVVCYVVVRGQLRDQVDAALKAQAAAIENGDFHSLSQQVPTISGERRWPHALRSGRRRRRHAGSGSWGGEPGDPGQRARPCDRGQPVGGLPGGRPRR